MEETIEGMEIDMMEGTERSSKRRNVGKGRRRKSAADPFDKSSSQISKPTLKAINDMNSSSISLLDQGRTVQSLMGGDDSYGTASIICSRGSLPFLVQAVELLYHCQFRPCDGAGIIVICTGRMLALEAYAVAKELLKYHSLTLGLILGGFTMRVDAEHVTKGANVIIATPGKLLNLLQKTKGFVYENLKCLMIDVTNSVVTDMYAETINQIKEILPKTVFTRQAAFFPAVPHARVTLQHGFCIVPSAKRLLYLCTFLKRKQLKKLIVFFSSSNLVKFHTELLKSFHINCFDIHEEKELQSQESALSDFCKAWTGILLCTDVAARDLKFPAVDWIVQYNLPDHPKNYMDRVGRMARGEVLGANTLLFLIPEELPFLQLLQAAKVPIKKFVCPGMKLKNMQKDLEKVVADNYSLRKSAEDAYRSYMLAYKSHSMKGILNFDSLNLQAVAASFGLPTTSMAIMHSQQEAQVQEDICSKLADFSIDSLEKSLLMEAPSNKD